MKMQNNNPMNIFRLLSSNNPNQIIETMVANNPNAKIALNQMQQSGMTPKDYAMQYAKQNNIDINQVIQNLRSMGLKL